MTRIVIYTCFAPLFGRLAHTWAKKLEQRGYKVKVEESVNYGDKPLPKIKNVDIHFFLGGVFILYALNNFGFPKEGKTILWLCEPLIENPKSSHFWKFEIFREVGSYFNSIAGMNESIVSIINTYFPSVKTFTIPYVIEKKHIETPKLDHQKKIEILQLGRASEHRKKVETHFIKSKVQAAFIYGGQYGQDKYQFISEAKISLNLHHDGDYRYFGQHRIFDAWAAGSLVVSEPMGQIKNYGVIKDEHIVISDVSEMPYVCKELLHDNYLRQRVIGNAQQLLRNRYTPDCWIDEMEKMIHKTLSP